MTDGRLREAPRDVIHRYVRSEAGVLGIKLPAFELVALWIDNLAPPLDAVSASVARLLQDKARFSRLLPWLLKVVRSQPDFPDQEESIRELISRVRAHFREADGNLPQGIRASS
jgi:hypothetical protein